MVSFLIPWPHHQSYIFIHYWCVGKWHLRKVKASACGFNFIIFKAPHLTKLCYLRGWRWEHVSQSSGNSIHQSKRTFTTIHTTKSIRNILQFSPLCTIKWESMESIFNSSIGWSRQIMLGTWKAAEESNHSCPFVLTAVLVSYSTCVTNPSTGLLKVKSPVELVILPVSIRLAVIKDHYLATYQ